MPTRVEIEERIAVLKEEIRDLEEQLANWPDNQHQVDTVPPDTDPETPERRKESSQKMKAIREPIRLDLDDSDDEK